MKILPDGRLLLAAKAEIGAFFEQNRIVGRKIADLKPLMLDYVLTNLCDIEQIYKRNCGSSISTDGRVCIVFEDGGISRWKFRGAAR